VSIGLLLVTHGKLGHLMLETMTDMLGELTLKTDVLEVRRVQATDVLLRQGLRMIERLDEGQGVLVLTDAYGSTPANIANKLAANAQRTLVVAGVNLPMLVRVFNYPALSLDAMAQTAVEGGQKGIMLCPRIA
jgi:PTS system mannose-specific IIA component